MSNIDIIHGDCLEVMKYLPDGCIDLVVTSPPYDNLRTYTGEAQWNFEIFTKIADELSMCLKKGGVIVWVVGDATIKGSETGTSFRQALYSKDECGLNIHDTMIYDKGYAPNPSKVRYNQSFEYMFCFSKGKPKTINQLREPRTTKGNRTTSTFRQADGTLLKKEYKLNDTRVKRNIWYIDNGFMRSSKDKTAFKHPASFPEQLAHDHIISWSNPGDLVFDPFTGSGTTAKMASKLGRNFLGSEISEDYVKIARERLNV